MVKTRFDTDIDGQFTIDQLLEDPNDRLFAVHRIFARARKDMNLAEQKTFVYALSELKFTEEPPKSGYVRLDKKKLADLLGIHADPTDLSSNLFREIKELPKHSFIQIHEKDLDLYASGVVVTSIVSFKNIVRIKFNEEYLGLFTHLTSHYITMWSGDIFQMRSKRSVKFYEELRQLSYGSEDGIFSAGFGIRALKEMFDIPMDGKGSYMRVKSGFDRAQFEKRVIDPLCEDLKNCKMITLLLQPDGRYYQKVKQGNRVSGYMFFWTLSYHPRVATAGEVKTIQERADKNPELLKVAKDILSGERKKSAKKPKQPNPEEHGYDYNAIEQELIMSQINNT